MFALRALWVVDTSSEEVLFTRLFPAVERRMQRMQHSTPYTPLPHDVNSLAIAAVRKHRDLSPEALRSTTFVSVSDPLSGLEVPRPTDDGPSTGDQSNDGNAAGCLFGPFLFQWPTHDIRSGSSGCYPNHALVIVALPMLSHLSLAATVGGEASSVAAATLDGAGSLLELPCLTALQAVLTDYIAPFTSSVCIARHGSVELGLSIAASRRAELIDEQAAAIRQPTKSTFRFGRNTNNDDSAVSDKELETPIVIVSLRAWQLALHGYIATYLPFGASSFMPPPTVGLVRAVQRLQSGLGADEEASPNTHNGGHNGRDAAPISIVDQILRMEGRNEIGYNSDQMTIGDDGSQHRRRVGSSQHPPPRGAGGMGGAQGASAVAAGESLQITVVEEVSARVFGPQVAAATSVVRSVYIQRPREGGRYGSPTSSSIAPSSDDLFTRPATVTFVVLGLSSQAAAVVVSPEVHLLSHRQEYVNTKNRLFASNTAATDAVMRHAAFGPVFRPPLKGSEGGCLGLGPDEGKGDGAGDGEVDENVVGTAAAQPNGVSPRASSEPQAGLSDSKKQKVVEATFVQAIVPANEDEPRCRLLQLPSVNNGQLAPLGGGGHAQGQSHRWREGAHQNVFIGTLEVIPIFSRPDGVSVENIRDNQLLVQFTVDLQLNLCPAIPRKRSVEEQQHPLDDTQPTIEPAADGFPKALMERMTVRLDFHNSTTIVAPTVEVTNAQPLGPPSVRATGPSTLEWTLPKATRRHGTEFRLEGTCVLTTAVDRQTTVLPVLDPKGPATGVGAGGVPDTADLSTLDFGKVPTIPLEGPVHKVDASGSHYGGHRYQRHIYRCPIPLVSASLDFEMQIPNQQSLLMPTEVLDLNAFAEAIGSADGRANPLSAGSIQGNCIVAPYVVVRSFHSGTAGATPACFDEDHHPLYGAATPAGSVQMSLESNLGGYIVWNRFNDAGFHLPQ